MIYAQIKATISHNMILTVTRIYQQLFVISQCNHKNIYIFPQIHTRVMRHAHKSSQNPCFSDGIFIWMDPSLHRKNTATRGSKQSINHTPATSRTEIHHHNITELNYFLMATKKGKSDSLKTIIIRNTYAGGFGGL